jgi:hypothetical protein
MKKLTFYDKATWNHLKQIKTQQDIKQGLADVMVPYLTDAELEEYCRARSSEVVTYKLAEVEI